jgi:hypothetical protein
VRLPVFEKAGKGFLLNSPLEVGCGCLCKKAEDGFSLKFPPWGGVRLPVCERRAHRAPLEEGFTAIPVEQTLCALIVGYWPSFSRTTAERSRETNP